MSDSLWSPRTAARQASLPFKFPRVCSNSCPLSQWCHPTISPSVDPSFSCPQSFPASGSFPVSWLFTSGGQSIGVSASASDLSVNIQGWFPLGLTGLISLLSKGSQESFPVPQFETFNSSAFSLLYSSTLICVHDYWKNHSLTRWTVISKVMSLLFNTLSRLVTTFLPRSKGLLISWLQSPSAVILKPKKIKSVTVSTFPLSVCHEVMGSLHAMIFGFWTLKALNVIKVIILVKNLN